MISLVAKLVGSPHGRKWLRLTVQTAVSAALIVYLVHMACHENLAAAFSRLAMQPLVLACGFFAAAAVLSARRWQLLLRYQGIEESLVRLTEVYVIGLFCSLFLPTAAGGDAFRVFDVARRHKATARVLLATMQERLVGLGAAMLVGLASAVWFWEILPVNLLAGVLVICCSGILAVALALEFGRIVAGIQQLIKGRRLPGALARWCLSPLAVRGAVLVAPLSSARQLPPRRTLRVVFLALATFTMSVLTGTVVCDALDVPCSPLALCLVISLVGVVRMVPIALNGIGIGESAFVFLMSLFGVPEIKAAPAALTLLGVQTAMSLGGGLLLLRRALLGSSPPAGAASQGENALGAISTPEATAAADDDQAPATILTFPAGHYQSGGKKRHAA